MVSKVLPGVGPKYPQVVVLFGATGDLARRKLLPGLFHLASAGFIPDCRIIGVSLDKISTLNEFSADPDYCAGKLPVASDADGKIAKSYELKVMDGRPGMKNTKGQDIDHGFTERTTFVVTPDGKVAATIGNMKPDENVLKALETVQGLKKPAA